MNPLTTARLRVVPATADLVRLEIENRNEFFRQLAVTPAVDWPSETLADVLPFFLEQLENDPSATGWLAWYWIHSTEEGGHLVGGGGFKGPPAEGVIEIGYETRTAFRQQGFATEAMRAIVNWALEHPDVSLIVAETRPNNNASISVLGKLGFVQRGPGSEAGLLRFEAETAVL